ETLECRRVLATANSLPDFYEVEQGEVLTVNDYAAAVLADGPVAYWQLNETSGPTAVDSAGSHDGAIGPAVGLGVPGAPQAGSGSTAFDFSGTADRVTVPYDPALNPTQFTIEAWARVDGGQGTWRS